MATYLITGGAGFIGSNITNELVKRGEKVKVLDNLATGYKKNLEPIIDQIEFIEGDFTDLETAQKACQGVDYILHQGAIASVPRSTDQPVETSMANVQGTLNMLIASRDNDVKRFVYAASSSAYGDSPTMPKTEDMPSRPKSLYATQKLTGEYYCQNFYQLYGLETVCLRYFNVFGPNQDPTSDYAAVIPIFVRLLLKGEQPTIFGDGETSRDFTYVANNVSANLLAATADSICAGEVINIACGESISLNQLVAEINKVLGTSIEPKYAPERAGDVKHSLADISKAKDLLGYETTVDFATGLKKTIEYYKGLV